jgi:hypothetical protein
MVTEVSSEYWSVWPSVKMSPWEWQLEVLSEWQLEVAEG